jgi:hypothetical protein
VAAGAAAGKFLKYEEGAPTVRVFLHKTGDLTYQSII